METSLYSKHPLVKSCMENRYPHTLLILTNLPYLLLRAPYHLFSEFNPFLVTSQCRFIPLTISPSRHCLILQIIPVEFDLRA